jgi:polyhydroxybutyrate depolymerase
VPSRRARLGLLTAAALAAGCGAHPPGHASTPASPRAARCSHLSAGGRWVEGAWVHVPARAPARPSLLLAFHGTGDPVRSFGDWTRLQDVADRRRFILAAPASEASQWQLDGARGDEDVRRTIRLLDRLESTACVDPARVYLTGFSNGGGFATRLACELASRVAAVASVMGSYAVTPFCPAHGPRVALMEVHGDDRFAVSVPRLFAMWRPRDGCSSRADVTYPRAGVVRTGWRGCPVVRVHLVGTPHVWPGSRRQRAGTRTTFAAAEEAWAFMSRYRRCGRGLCS